MNFNKFQKISISFFLIVFLLSAFYFLLFDRALAAEVSLNCDKNPNAYPWCSEAKSGNFGVLVNRFYVIALGLGAASAFGVLIYGAILWTMSGAVTSKQDAMEWISGAIWGLVLLLGAYLILYTINPTLVALKNPGDLITPVRITPTVTPPGTLTGLPVDSEGYTIVDRTTYDGLKNFGKDCKETPVPGKSAIYACKL